MPFRLLCLLISSIWATAITAQDNPPGRVDSLYSTVLGEQRFLQVVLPEEYSAAVVDPDSIVGTADRYETLYLLDGGGNLEWVRNTYRFLRDQGYVPPLILVAIRNVDRNRDFLPTFVEDIPTSGGADKFLSFIGDELLPHIAANYPANGENVLYGHSFGGVFALYALLQRPELFHSYLAVDPSFWWDGGALREMAAERLPSLRDRNRSLFYSGREGPNYTSMGITAMDAVLDSLPTTGFYRKSVAYADETHGSIRYKSIYDGLRFAFEGYRNARIELHPMAGVVQSGKPLPLFILSDVSAARYTLDGSEPTLEYPLLTPELHIAEPVTLKVKNFSRPGKSFATTTVTYTAGKSWPAQPQPAGTAPGGWRYRYYEGKWDSLPDFSHLSPLATGIAGEDFNFAQLPHQENFALLIEGWLKVDRSGYHIFALDSDDGARLYLNEQLILDRDGLHGTGDVQSFVVPLQPGFYPIRLEYFQREGGLELMHQYLPPDSERPVDIPYELRYAPVAER